MRLDFLEDGNDHGLTVIMILEDLINRTVVKLLFHCLSPYYIDYYMQHPLKS